MKKCKLSEIFNLQMGKTPARNNLEYWENGTNPWISIADMTTNGRFIKRTKENITDRAVYETGIKPIYPETVIMSFKLSVGKVAQATAKAYSNEAIMAFEIKSSESSEYSIDNNYAYYLLSALSFENVGNKAVMGKTLNKSILEDTVVYIHKWDEQRKIISKLDKVNDLIEIRKQQLSKLDELVKSRFIELFGDYDLSHIQSEWKTISEIGKVVGGATPKTNIEEYWDGEYRWITPAELDTDSGYIYDSVRKLTKAGIESCSLQEIPINTVILSSRAPIGKVAITGNTFYCNQGFKNIICDKDVLPRYLYTVLLLNTDYLNSLGRGATFKEISKSIVENIKIPVPPIDLQNQFATFVEQTDKLKFEVKQSLEQLETLKKSLMQQYFG